MIITGVDERNLFVAVDVLQAKILVEVLRDMQKSHNWSHYIGGSNSIMDAGFQGIMADQVRDVLGSFAGVLGFWTDRVEKRKDVPPPPAAPDDKSPIEGEPAPEGKKTYIN